MSFLFYNRSFVNIVFIWWLFSWLLEKFVKRQYTIKIYRNCLLNLCLILNSKQDVLETSISDSAEFLVKQPSKTSADEPPLKSLM